MEVEAVDGFEGEISHQHDGDEEECLSEGHHVDEEGSGGLCADGQRHAVQALSVATQDELCSSARAEVETLDMDFDCCT